MIFIPTENDLDQLISGYQHQLATFLQTLKETAARYREALKPKINRLQHRNINTVNHTRKRNQPQEL